MVHAADRARAARRHPRAHEQPSPRRSRSSASCSRRRRRSGRRGASSSTAPCATSTSSRRSACRSGRAACARRARRRASVGQLDVPVVDRRRRDPPGRSRRAWTATARWRCRPSASTRCCRSRSSASERERGDARALRGGRALLRPAGAPRARRRRLMEVAVLGLGEAGGRIAADLVAAGCDGARLGSRAAARGDPERRERPRGGPRRRCRAQPQRPRPSPSPRRRASPASSRADALYADLNTSAPQLKRELAAALPVQFADVALIGIVPGTGLRDPGARLRRRAPSASPSSSGRSACPSRWSGQRPGDAAGLKLLRSVFMKGIAAAAIESLEAARAAGVEDRVRADIAGVLGEPLLERLLSGSRAHAARRVDEMRRPPPPTSRSSASSRASRRPRRSGSRSCATRR